MSRLILNPGMVDERVYELSPGVLTIGRTKDNDVYVLHKSLSRQHARLEISPDGVVLVDLDSKNGTYVNGARVERRALSAGDSFRCGDLVFQLAGESGGRGGREVVPTVVRDIHTQFEPVAALKAPRADGNSAERARDKLAILLKVSQLLSAPGTIDVLLAKIVDLVFQILDVDRAVLLLLDPESGTLEPRVTRGERSGAAFYSQHIVEYVRRNSVAALFADAREDPRLDTAASVLNQSICASMCAPLKPRDEVLGVLYVDNQSVANRFSEEDLEFLTAFANQAAIALDNSMLEKRLQEEAVLRSTFSRFFPPSTMRRIEEAKGGTLEIIETEVTALFCDISGFTRMSSTMQPREVARMLNEYFPVMADIIFRHEGTLEKYIGDAMMAVWGAPFHKEDDADRAVRAAVEMQRALVALNAKWREAGKPPIAIHVGLNTGPVAAGNIGSEQYIQYATIGDATNVASRACNAARAGDILVTEATRARLRGSEWALSPVDAAMVKGKDAPLVLYRVNWEGRTAPQAETTTG
jgi:adenylate cyclase